MYVCIYLCKLMVKAPLFIDLVIKLFHCMRNKCEFVWVMSVCLRLCVYFVVVAPTGVCVRQPRPFCVVFVVARMQILRRRTCHCRVCRILSYHARANVSSAVSSPEEEEEEFAPFQRMHKGHLHLLQLWRKFYFQFFFACTRTCILSLSLSLPLSFYQ